MGAYNTLPVFLKEKGNMGEQLETLRSMVGSLDTIGENRLSQDIKSLVYSIEGEEEVTFELKNSFMPNYILHDVYLEYEGLTSQIDFLVFTNKVCFIIECKNLYGNIEIDKEGNFLRITKFNDDIQKVGFNSPYTQVQRHLDMVKYLDSGRKKSMWRTITGNHQIDCCYVPVIVFTNPRTIIDMSYTKPEIKDKVIRLDQLVSYIKEKYKQSNISPRSDKETREWAEYYLGLHRDIMKCYIKRYDKYKITAINTENHKGQEIQEGQKLREEQERWEAQELKEEHRLREERKRWEEQKLQEEQRLREELERWQEQKLQEKQKLEEERKRQEVQKLQEKQKLEEERKSWEEQKLQEKQKLEEERKSFEELKYKEERRIEDDQEGWEREKANIQKNCMILKMKYQDLSEQIKKDIQIQQAELTRLERQARQLRQEICDAKKSEGKLINLLILNELITQLKNYRLKKSREENKKAFLIYNNLQLFDLILKMPKDKDELKQVADFGELKVNKYGDSILEILDKFKDVRKSMEENTIKQLRIYNQD